MSFIRGLFAKTPVTEHAAEEENGELLPRKALSGDHLTQQCDPVKTIIGLYLYGVDFRSVLLTNKALHNFYSKFLDSFNLRESYRLNLAIDHVNSQMRILNYNYQIVGENLDDRFQELKRVRSYTYNAGCVYASSGIGLGVGTGVNAVNCCVQFYSTSGWTGWFYPLAIPYLVGDSIMAGGIITAAITCGVGYCVVPSEYPALPYLEDLDSAIAGLPVQYNNLDDEYRKRNYELLNKLSIFQAKLRAIEAVEEEKNAVQKKGMRSKSQG